MAERPLDFGQALTLELPAPRFVPDPEVLAMPGIDRMRSAVAGTRPMSPVFRFSGMRPTDAGLGMVTMSMPASPWWQTGAGVFGAGVLAFAADAPASGAVLTSVPGGFGITTSQLALDFLRPATIRSQNIIARGRLVHGTKSQGLAEVFVEDGYGRLLAHGTSRCMIVAIKEGGRPTPVSPSEPEQDPGPSPYELPVEGLVRGQELWDTTPGMEILQEARRNGGYRTPVTRFLGLRILEIGDGEVAVTMAASRWLTSGTGTLYGGALAAFADYTANCALVSIIPPATAFAPLDLKVNFVRPAVAGEGELVARAKLVHRGRSVAIVHCEILSAEGKPVAIANESILILPGRPWARPVHVAEEASVNEDPIGTRPRRAGETEG